MNLRGLSGIISSVLLVLVGLVAIGIFAVIVVNVGGPALSPAFECVDLQTSRPITIEEACLNSETEEVEIKLARGINEEFVFGDLDFVILGGGGSASFECGPSCGNGCRLPGFGEKKSYFFGVEDLEGVEEAIIAISGCELGREEIGSC